MRIAPANARNTCPSSSDSDQAPDRRRAFHVFARMCSPSGSVLVVHLSLSPYLMLGLHRFPSSISNRAASSITSSPFVFKYPHIFTTHLHFPSVFYSLLCFSDRHCNRNGTRTASSLGLCNSDRACVCSSASSLIFFFVFRPNERGKRKDLRCGFGLAGDTDGRAYLVVISLSQPRCRYALDRVAHIEI